jgi:isoquinoline 1-oxidoreductase beta subunit
MLVSILTSMQITRRALLWTGLAAGGGLGVFIARKRLDDGDVLAKFGDPDPAVSTLNAWLRIATDGSITCGVHRAEMGQGVTTSLPMLLAEELDADWRGVRYVFTPVDSDYFNFGILLRGRPLGPVEDRFWAGVGTDVIREVFHQLGMGVTISSSSTVDAWDALRLAGAQARAQLVAAAATRWSAPAGRLLVADSVVTDPETGRRAGFGDLAADAAGLPPARDVPLKAAQNFKLLGRSLPRLDIPEHVTGSARYALDTRLPGLLHGAVKHAPSVNGRIDAVRDTAARALPGVEAIVPLGERAVAVLATDTWTAFRAAALLEIDELPDARAPDTPDLERAYRTALGSGTASVFRDDEAVAAAFAVAGARTFDAVFDLPFLAHVCMEPMNCAAHVDRGRLRVWAPTQAPSIARDEAAKAAGLPPEQVDIVQMRLGGGFGRRAEMDFVVQAVQAAMAVPGRPVQLAWSREEDVRHDMYRPAASGRVRGVLGVDGLIAALDYRLVSESVVASNHQRTPTARGGEAAKDRSALGGAFEPPYAIPALRMAYVPRDDGIPTGFWRSVSSSINPFLLESAVDELALLAGSDPVMFRLAHLAERPDAQNVLRAVAELGQWAVPIPATAGRRSGRGVAFIESHDSLVGTVIEVSVGDASDLVIERISCVADCRTVIHPGNVEAQITGGILDGLAAALTGRITLRDGRVEQGNFNDYPWPRLGDVPPIAVQLLPQGGRPGGVGEPGVPGVAPALCNAIFAATGIRIRSLPVLDDAGRVRRPV